MEVVKRTKEYTVYRKRSNRYAVKGRDQSWIRGDDKARILLAESLIKLTAARPKEASPDEEAAAGEASADQPAQA